MTTSALYIGLDDTDTLESPGTGSLARLIAAQLAQHWTVLGVTRHQLLDDPRVPRTAKNSCAAIALSLDGSRSARLGRLLDRVTAIMLQRFQPGSDPGLCIAASVPPEVTAFGRRVQRELVVQSEARALAAEHGVTLVGLGGSEDGVIGALAAVGLAAAGDNGRYILVGRSRELTGLRPVADLLAAGITEVRSRDGQPVTNGLVQTDRLRPALMSGAPVAIVEWCQDHWLPLKID